MYAFTDDFDDGALTGWSNLTPAVTVSPAAAHSGAFGMRQAADGVNAGVASLSDATLPDGYTYCEFSFWHRIAAHGAGNSPVITVQNRTGSDHADLFANFTAGGRFWWDLRGTDNAQHNRPVAVGSWYHFRGIVYFGGTTWTMRLWINAVPQPTIASTGKTPSDVRAVHLGGFAGEVNERHYDDVRIVLSTTDPDPPPVFPEVPLDTRVELYTGTWTDITGDVYLDNPIAITRGRDDEGSHTDPSACTLTLNNRDGRYSSRNPMSPLYGLIGRNTPIRVSVPAGETFLYLPGTTGHATTPDHSSLDITGDLDVRAEVTVEEWANTTAGLVSKWVDAGNQLSWTLWLEETGALTLFWSPNGATVIAATSTVPVPPQLRHQAVRATLDVDNGAGGWTVTHFTAPTLAGPWTQLGAPISGTGITSVFNSSAPVQVGELLGAEVRGRVHAAEIRNGINGTLVAAPTFSVQAPGTTSFTDPAGRVWSLTGDAEITDRAYRFHGEVSSWPPRWDTSGHDVYVPIEAAGILRRLGQGKKPLASALRRSIGGATPRYAAWWPLEDAEGASQAAPGYPGLPPMRTVGDVQFGQELTGGIGTGVQVGDTGRLFGSVPTAGMGEWTIAVWLDLPLDMGTDGVSPVLEWRTPGAPVSVSWNLYTGQGIGGKLILESARANNTIVISALGNIDLRGRGPVQVLVSGVTNGADVLAVVKVDGVDDIAPPSPGDTIAPITTAGINMSTTSSGLTVSGIATHLIVAPRSREGAILSHVAAGRGYTGELTTTRIGRLAREENLAVNLIGRAADTSQLGPQRPRPVLDLLAESGEADGGTLHEQRDWLALRYRSRASDYNRTPVLTLDYLTQVAAPLEPVDDDQATRNDVTVEREGGSSAQVVRQDGPLSVQPPPNGVGRYDHTVSLNLAGDGQLLDQAGHRVHLGTWDEARYPVVTVKLHKHPDLIPAATAVDVRSLIRLTGLPPWLPPGPVDLIVEGYTETLSKFEWTIACNTTPGGPWTVGVLDDPVLGRLDTDGAQLASPVTSTATSLQVATTAGPVWVTDPAEFPFDVVLGGELVTVTAISGTSSPQTFTVVRSVNGVVKPHLAGADVRLAQPMTLSF